MLTHVRQSELRGSLSRPVQLIRTLDDDLRLEQYFDDPILNPFHHRLEEIEGLSLVLDQRIPLSVSAETDTFLEVIENEEVILPLFVEDFEDQYFLVQSHVLVTDESFALDVASFDCFEQVLFDDVSSHFRRVDA